MLNAEGEDVELKKRGETGGEAEVGREESAATKTERPNKRRESSGVMMKRALMEKDQSSSMTFFAQKTNCIVGRALEEACRHSQKLFNKTHDAISFHSNHVTCTNATKVRAEEARL